MGKGANGVKVFDYRMSMHMGICAAGEGLELLEIKVGDKVAWSGNKTNAEVLAIDKPDLFGGPTKEGGLLGLAWWLPGKSDQVLPDPLARRFGLLSTSAPGFRGLASIFFTGTGKGNPSLMPTLYEGLAGFVGNITDLFTSITSMGFSGFKWTTNNPYLKEVSVRVFRPPETDLDPDFAIIPMGEGVDGRIMRGVNPAHVVYEVMTNKDWGGMQGDSSSIDLDSFEEAAVTLFNEGFAFRMLWDREMDSYSFLSMIMDHISARLRPDPATGLYKLTLLRNDYDADALPVINPDNAILTTPPTRRAWGDIVNEVKVSWTNPRTGEQESVSAQDPAGIAIQGGINTSSKTMEGIGIQDTALQVAERELTSMVQPLLTCSASVTRSFWDTITGDVVKLSWPEYGIENVIMRVITVGFSGRRITLGLVEDVFGFEHGSYLSTSAGTMRRSSTVTPLPLTRYHFGTLPAYFTVSALGLTDADDLVYPEALPMTLFAPETDDDIGYRLIGYAPDGLGVTRPVNLGDKALQGSWLLHTALVEEVQTNLTTDASYQGPLIEVGSFLFASDGTDAGSELMTVSDITDTHWVVERGLMDTVPRPWPVGTRVMVIPPDASTPDNKIRAVGEVVEYRQRTRTSSGILPIASAPLRSATMTNRPYLPLRPANVTLNGVAFGDVVLGAATTLDLTWANRNRVTDSGQLSLWGDADVAGESGQTTSILVYDDTLSLITSFTGLTGTSYSFARSALAGNSVALVKVISKVSTNESLQGITYRVIAGAVALALDGDQVGDVLSYSGDQSADRLDVGDF